MRINCGDVFHVIKIKFEEMVIQKFSYRSTSEQPMSTGIKDISCMLSTSS